MISKDTLWKGIIEDLVDEFVLYFFPDFVHRIDFEKGFTFMDKELEQLMSLSESKLRHADKLFRSWLKDGTEQWFLIHVEVQGYPDPEFAKRMFQYAYRILDRYDRPLTALAIYTDTNRAFHFSEYRNSFFGTEHYYSFHSFVLVDHEPEELRQKENIFGLVMEVARLDLDYQKKDDPQRLRVKKELVRHLFKHGVPKQKIQKLLNFIKYYIRFEEEEFFHKFEEDIQIITKSRQAMGIEEAILHEMETKGHAAGFVEGIEQGLEQGIEQGLEQKERIVIIRCLEKGIPPTEIAELADIPLEKVEAIIQELLLVSEEEE